MDAPVYDKIKAYFSRFRLLKYEKGEYVIHSQKNPDSVFFLKSGYVKMNSIFEDGRELTLNIFRPGSFFPMIWAIAEKENSFYFQTLTTCKLYAAPKNNILKFLKDNPDVLFDLTKRILSGLDGFLTNTQNLLFGNADHRVLSALTICAVRFGTKEDEDKITINIPLTHQDIASLSGLTRETVSTTIMKLEKNKTISYRRNKLTIFDTEKIKRLFENIENKIGDPSFY